MKKFILCLILMFITFLQGSTQVLYTITPDIRESYRVRSTLYKTDLSTNQVNEFYKNSEFHMLTCKVSPNDDYLAIRGYQKVDNSFTTSTISLKILNPKAEIVLNSSDLTNFHIQSFCFSPNSKYIAFISGIDHPYPEADHSYVPVGFGILSIEDKSIEWIIGGPDKIDGPLLDQCIWPSGKYIYANGYTNDDNNILKSFFGIDPITFQFSKKGGNYKDYKSKLFTINTGSNEINATELPDILILNNFSPDGHYYFTHSAYDRLFEVYDTRSAEKVAYELITIIGDSLFYDQLQIKPKWLGSKGAILALDINPASTYKNGMISGPSQWIIDVSSMKVLYEAYTDEMSFDLGPYWKTSSKNLIVKKKNNEFQQLESSVVDKIKKASSNERGIE